MNRRQWDKWTDKVYNYGLIALLLWIVASAFIMAGWGDVLLGLVFVCLFILLAAHLLKEDR